MIKDNEQRAICIDIHKIRVMNTLYKYLNVRTQMYLVITLFLTKLH